MRLNSVAFLAAEIVQVVEIYLRKKQWSFYPMNIIILVYSLVTARSHAIDVLLPDYSGLGTRRVKHKLQQTVPYHHYLLLVKFVLCVAKNDNMR